MFTSNRVFLLISLLFVCSLVIAQAKKDEDEKPAWAKKKITDYSDADMERLLDQWNVRICLRFLKIQQNKILLTKMLKIIRQEDDDDGDPDDDTPEHLRPAPQIDISQMDTSNPENLLKVSKKGRTVMTFVTVSGSPSRLESEEITKVWQTSLWNANIQAEKYTSLLFLKTFFCPAQSPSALMFVTI